MNYKNAYEEMKRLYERLEQENQKLKKQIEEYKKWYQDELEENSKLSELWCDSRAKIRKLENQQKEFIEYMEEKIICYENHQNTNLGEYERNLYFDLYNDILEKYKEIIGVSK